MTQFLRVIQLCKCGPIFKCYPFLVVLPFFTCYHGRLLSVTHFLRVTHFCNCMTYFSSDDPDTPVTYFSQISWIFGARGRGYPKTLEKIWIFYNRLNRGVQTQQTCEYFASLRSQREIVTKITDVGVVPNSLGKILTS